MIKFILLILGLFVSAYADTSNMKIENTNIDQKKIIPSADTDSWILGKGTYEDFPTLIRYRPNLIKYLGMKGYTQRLVITWNYKTSEIDNGMPSNKELNDMASFENKIISVLDPDRLAILAFVYTTNGKRELHFYIQDIKLVSSKIDIALKDFPKLPIILSLKNDPNWNTIKIVIEGANN